MKAFFSSALVFLMHSHTVAVAKGAAIAGAGVALTYTANHLGDLNLGENSAIVAAILMVFINAGRKSLAAMQGTSISPPE